MYIFGILYNLLQDNSTAKLAIELDYSQVLWKVRAAIDSNLVLQVDTLLGILDEAVAKFEQGYTDSDSILSEDGEEDGCDDYVDEVSCV